MSPNQAETIHETPLAVSEASGEYEGEKIMVPIASSYTNDEITDHEMRDMATMLTNLTEEEIASFPDDHLPLRHLRAEKGDITKAVTKLKAALQWRKEFGVEEIVQSCCGNPPNAMSPIIQKENETSKLYVRGYDKDGRALLYMRPAKENTQDAINNMRHLVWNLEKAIACSAKNGRSKICIVIDYDEFQLRHAPPMSTSRYTLDILQKHYPERMHKAYICNPPFVFRTFWSLIRPFIDPTTKEKIVFCHGKKGLEQIANDVGTDHREKYLEKCAGGVDTLPPVLSKEYLALSFDKTYGEE